jgi:hypothetical protein
MVGRKLNKIQYCHLLGEIRDKTGAATLEENGNPMGRSIFWSREKDQLQTVRQDSGV